MTSAPRDSEPACLDRMTVRLIDESDRPDFDRRLQADHYLASAAVVGCTLRYVAEVDGQCVALLVFSDAAIHLKGRERISPVPARSGGRRCAHCWTDSVAWRTCAAAMACAIASPSY